MSLASLLKAHLESALELPVLVGSAPSASQYGGLRAVVLAADRQQVMDSLDRWCDYCYKNYRTYEAIYYIPDPIRKAGGISGLNALFFEVHIKAA